MVTAFLMGALGLFLLMYGSGEGQETVTCPTGVTADVCINFPEQGSGTVFAYTAKDPEGEDVAWALSPSTAAENADAGDFSIDSSTGILTFITPPDFEAPGDTGLNNVYNVVIRATDDKKPDTPLEIVDDSPRANFVDRTLVITVTDVEEAGVVTLTALQPQEGVAISATLRDPDGTPRTTAISGAVVPEAAKDLTNVTATTTWQWARSSRAAGPWTDISGATMASHTPTADDVGMYLRALAAYDDGHCGFSDTGATPCDPKKTAHAISANPVQADPSNEPPSFQDENGENIATTTRSVAENSEAGTAVGAPVAATDLGPDGRQETLTYALSGSSASSFDMDSGTGQIRVKDALDFDQATGGTATYSLTVTATDPSNQSGTIVVTVMVTDVDEPPTIAAPTQSQGHVSKEHEENTPANTEVSTYSATDPDGDEAESLKWSLSGRDAAAFRIGNYSSPDERGKLYFRDAPDYEAATDSGRDNVYEVTVEVTDRGGNKASRDVTVSVSNRDEEGLLTVSNKNPQVGTRIIATLTDPDTPISNVDWTWRVAGADDGNTDTYTPKAADEGDTLEVEVSYTDGTGGNQSETLTLSGIQARPTSSNSSPRFPATTPTRLTVSENENAGIAVGGRVTAEDANDGPNLTYSLSGGDAAFLIDQDTGQISTRTTLDREKRGSYRVTVTAEDPSGASDTHSLTIEVTNVNEPPAITGGDAPTVYYAENGRGSVAAYRAEDPEGSRIVWSLTGDDAESLTISNGVLRFRSPPDYETKAGHSYSVEINAGDGTELDTEEITINLINVDEPGGVMLNHQPRQAEPVIASLTDEDTVDGTPTWQWARSPSRSGPFTDIEDDEDTQNVTEGKEASYEPRKDDVGMYLRATATYRDEQGGGKTAFVISNARTLHQASGEPRFLADDGAVLEPGPGASPDTADTDDNNPKTFATALTAGTPEIKREIAENARHGTNVGLPVAAVDIGDDGRLETLTYALGGTDAAKFDIGSSNGQIRVKSGFTPDHEGPAATASNCAVLNACVVTVTVTDPSNNSNTVTVNIEITNVDESPVLTISTATPPAGVETLQSGYRHAEPVGDSPTTFSITFVADDPETPNENNNEALEWKLTGTDADDFVIGDNPNTSDTEPDGVLTFKSGPDYEAATDSGRNNGYDVTVQVIDDGGNTDSHRVRVTVTNVDEAGTIAPSHTQPEVGAPLTASLTDPDTPRSISWQWYRGDASTDGTSLDADVDESCSAADVNGVCAIDRATRATYSPVADDTGDLTVVASYTDGHDSGKIAIFTTAPVQAEDEDNVDPQFQNDNDERITRDTREVREDVVAGASAVVGAPVAAVDEDTDSADDTALVYTLSGTDAQFFDIGEATGQITVRAGTMLDYETRKSYRVTVRVLDPSARSAQITITINVVDVDERPELSEKGLAALGDGNILYLENGDSVVGQYTATGPNANRVSWRLTGLDAADFSISSAGQLTFRSTPNFESPADSDRDNIYEFTVVARSGSIQDEVSVIVEVINVDEEGEVALSQTRGTVGSQITATLTDPDGDISGIDWEWERSRDGNVGWRGIPGATSNSYTSEADDAGHYLRAVAYYTDAQGAGKSASGRTTAAVLTDDDGVVTLSSDRLAVGDSVTASLRDPDGNVRNVSWQWASSSNRSSGWSDIPGATSSTYTVAVADVDNFLRATASYDDGDGTGKSAEAVTTAAVVEDDDGVVTLSPTGASVGDRVTATLTDPDGGITRAAWQWASSPNGTSNWTNMAGATSPTYTVAAGDLGKFLRATVIYDDAAGAGKSSEAVMATAITADDDGAVTLSPTGLSDGEQVTATLTDPDGGVTGLTWQWASSANGTSNWVNIQDATSASYTAVTTDVGRYLRATANYTDAVGSGKSAEAITAAPVAEDDDGSVSLSPSSFTAGDTVTATLTDPDGGVADVTWQWATSETGTSDWVIILGANSDNYTPPSAGVYLRATANYTDAVGSGKSAEAITAAPVAEDDDGSVNLSPSSLTAGETLTATLVDPDGGVTDVTWQWATSESGTSDWVIIPEATSSSYTPTAANVGSYLRATATYTDAVGHGKSAEGITAAAVAEDDDGVVTLSTSAPRVGSSVTASLSDPDGGVTGITWQWEKFPNGTSEWTAIAGITSSSYTPRKVDLGSFFRVTASYTDALGSGKSAGTVTTSAVAVRALIDKYDRNDNGSIEGSEAIEAVKGYFKDEISLTDVVWIIQEYFAS